MATRTITIHTCDRCGSETTADAGKDILDAVAVDVRGMVAGSFTSPAIGQPLIARQPPDVAYGYKRWLCPACAGNLKAFMTRALPS